MPESKPLYLVFVCPNCIAIRHFRPKGDGSDIYYCPVCKFEVNYIDGRIVKKEAGVTMPYNGKGRPRKI